MSGLQNEHDPDSLCDVTKLEELTLKSSTRSEAESDLWSELHVAT